MTHYGALFMRDCVDLSCGKRDPVIQKRARFNFIDFVRPDCYLHYTIEQTFGVFGWMCQTAHDYMQNLPDQGYGLSGPKDLLSMKPSCIGCDVEPITSRADLQQRFNWVLLSAFASNHARKWKEQNGISVTASKIISFPHFKPYTGHRLCEADICKSADALLSCSGKLTAQLNQYHRAARNIYGVKVHYSPFTRGFVFVLDYGYDGSVWHHDLSEQAKGEPFITAMFRATDALAKLRDTK